VVTSHPTAVLQLPPADRDIHLAAVANSQRGSPATTSVVAAEAVGAAATADDQTARVAARMVKAAAGHTEKVADRMVVAAGGRVVAAEAGRKFEVATAVATTLEIVERLQSG